VQSLGGAQIHLKMGPTPAGLDGNGLQTWRGDKYRPKDLRDKIEKDFANRDCMKMGLFDLVLSTTSGHAGIVIFKCSKKGCEREVGLGNPDQVRGRALSPDDHSLQLGPFRHMSST